jgi:16S rRNA (cytidine1402-2'-O)-methyltransferase
LADQFAAEGPPKGEIVVLIGAPAEGALTAAVDDSLDEKLKDALARHSIKDAAALVAAETGRPRRAVYARALALAKDRP